MKKNTKSDELLKLEEVHGTIFVIAGKNGKGEEVEMYLKKPDYKLRKALFITLASAKDTDQMNALITAGEMIISSSCRVGGYDMYADEDMRLEAAMKAAEIAEINTTVELKKS